MVITKAIRRIAVFLFCLAAAGCAVPKFDGSYASLRSALLRGEIKDALAFYEAEARQMEKNATTIQLCINKGTY
jgi:hypothetical protein